MPITESDIEKIALLAQLEITDEERRALTPQLASIVAYVEQLDVSAAKPALGGLTAEGARTDTSRDDAVLPSLGQSLALDQAPAPAAGHFRVPKVL